MLREKIIDWTFEAYLLETISWFPLIGIIENDLCQILCMVLEFFGLFLVVCLAPNQKNKPKPTFHEFQMWLTEIVSSFAPVFQEDGLQKKNHSLNIDCCSCFQITQIFFLLKMVGRNLFKKGVLLTDIKNINFSHFTLLLCISCA